MPYGKKIISELTIAKLKVELTKRGLGTMGIKSELYLTHEQHIRTTERENQLEVSQPPTT